MYFSLHDMDYFISSSPRLLYFPPKQRNHTNDHLNDVPQIAQRQFQVNKPAPPPFLPPQPSWILPQLGRHHHQSPTRRRQGAGLPPSAPPPRPPKTTSKLFSFFPHHCYPNSGFCYHQPVCASVTIPVFTPGKDKKNIVFQNAKVPWHTSRPNPRSLPSAHVVRSKPTCRSLSEPALPTLVTSTGPHPSASSP